MEGIDDERTLNAEMVKFCEMYCRSLRTKSQSLVLFQLRSDAMSVNLMAFTRILLKNRHITFVVLIIKVLQERNDIQYASETVYDSGVYTD